MESRRVSTIFILRCCLFCFVLIWFFVNFYNAGKLFGHPGDSPQRLKRLTITSTLAPVQDGKTEVLSKEIPDYEFGLESVGLLSEVHLRMVSGGQMFLNCTDGRSISECRDIELKRLDRHAAILGAQVFVRAFCRDSSTPSDPAVSCVSVPELVFERGVIVSGLNSDFVCNEALSACMYLYDNSAFGRPADWHIGWGAVDFDLVLSRAEAQAEAEVEADGSLCHLDAVVDLSRKPYSQWFSHAWLQVAPLATLYQDEDVHVAVSDTDQRYAIKWKEVAAGLEPRKGWVYFSVDGEREVVFGNGTRGNCRAIKGEQVIVPIPHLAESGGGWVVGLSGEDIGLEHTLIANMLMQEKDDGNEVPLMAEIARQIEKCVTSSGASGIPVLLLDRAESATRHLQNSKAVLELMRDIFGESCVIPKLTLESLEHAKAVLRRVRVIVGPHGTNLVFGILLKAFLFPRSNSKEFSSRESFVVEISPATFQGGARNQQLRRLYRPSMVNFTSVVVDDALSSDGSPFLIAPLDRLKMHLKEIKHSLQQSMITPTESTDMKSRQLRETARYKYEVPAIESLVNASDLELASRRCTRETWEHARVLQSLQSEYGRTMRQKRILFALVPEICVGKDEIPNTDPPVEVLKKAASAEDIARVIHTARTSLRHKNVTLRSLIVLPFISVDPVKHLRLFLQHQSNLSDPLLGTLLVACPTTAALAIGYNNGLLSDIRGISTLFPDILFNYVTIAGTIRKHPLFNARHIREERYDFGQFDLDAVTSFQDTPFQSALCDACLWTSMSKSLANLDPSAMSIVMPSVRTLAFTIAKLIRDHSLTIETGHLSWLLSPQFSPIKRDAQANFHFQQLIPRSLQRQDVLRHVGRRLNAYCHSPDFYKSMLKT